MLATVDDVVGHDMNMLHGKDIGALPECSVFIVRFRNEDDDIRATRAMARASGDGIAFDGKGNNRVNRVQYEELLKLRIPHELVAAPDGYKLLSAKTLRK